MSKFLDDLKRGEKGEAIAKDYFKFLGFKIRNVSKKQRKYYDFSIRREKLFYKIEVKFDEMAEKTGNMCFEMFDGNDNASGVLGTDSDYVVYIIPDNSVEDEVYHKILIIEASKLKSLLLNTSLGDLMRLTCGGDNRKFSMVLVPICEIEALPFVKTDMIA